MWRIAKDFGESKNAAYYEICGKLFGGRFFDLDQRNKPRDVFSSRIGGEFLEDNDVYAKRYHNYRDNYYWKFTGDGSERSSDKRPTICGR
jgi:hypothetical protein